MKYSDRVIRHAWRLYYDGESMDTVANVLGITVKDVQHMMGLKW